jgi:predicted signal transduction protein with EAL and GGDEF domain
MMGKQKYSDFDRDDKREQCWSWYCRGVTNMSAIGREVGIDARTVKAYVNYMRDETKKRMAEGDESAEILSGYKETIRAAWKLHLNARSENAKVGALGRVQDGLKAIAGMFGVSTAKQVVEQTGQIGLSVTGAELLAKLGGDEDTADLLKQLSTKIASRPLDTGDADARTE